MRREDYLYQISLEFKEFDDNYSRPLYQDWIIDYEDSVEKIKNIIQLRKSFHNFYFVYIKKPPRRNYYALTSGDIFQKIIKSFNKQGVKVDILNEIILKVNL